MQAFSLTRTEGVDRAFYRPTTAASAVQIIGHSLLNFFPPEQLRRTWHKHEPDDANDEAEVRYSEEGYGVRAWWPKNMSHVAYAMHCQVLWH